MSDALYGLYGPHSFTRFHTTFTATLFCLKTRRRGFLPARKIEAGVIFSGFKSFERRFKECVLERSFYKHTCKTSSAANTEAEFLRNLAGLPNISQLNECTGGVIIIQGTVQVTPPRARQTCFICHTMWFRPPSPPSPRSPPSQPSLPALPPSSPSQPSLPMRWCSMAVSDLTVYNPSGCCCGWRLSELLTTHDLTVYYGGVTRRLCLATSSTTRCPHSSKTSA
jgi:hypothetical protein